ncbi:MAG TPA: hypothetical protein VEU11_17175 [Terriglobales bacterium]|nr:hypothetical protein [Terriglobales bacterium]
MPLVICSKSTRSEVEFIASELGILEPFIVENGGAILIPAGYFPFPIGAARREGIHEVIRLGLPYAEVVAGLRRAAEASGCRIRGFYDMSAGEVAEALGIDRKQAARAKQREWDELFEPFAANPTGISSLLEHIGKEGLSWTREGRFYRARGRHNKGQAAQIVADLYRRLYQEEIVTVGIAYGPYDLSLFERVDVPIMLRPAEQRWSDAILELLQRSEASK